MSAPSAPNGTRPAMRQPGPGRRRSRLGLIALAALLAFMALVVWQSFEVGGVRCEVCLTYRGGSQCRSVDGNDEEEARMAATTNACAFLASGVTDGIACSRTPPDRSECRAVR